jgi:HD-like signal output (HDOD) protein
MIDLENRYFKTDHTRIGRMLAANWSLPKSVANTIAFHHNPIGNTDTSTTIVEIVSLSNLLIHMFNAGPDLVRIDLSQFTYLMGTVGFKPTDFPKLVDLIPSASDNLKKSDSD